MTPRVLRLRPWLKEVLWGGAALQSRFGKDAPPDRRIGESWEASCLEGHDSVDAASGRTLRDLFAADPVAFAGPGAGARGFPLLVKLLCTTDLLSLQVHPDDPQARALDRAPNGKREAWLVLDAAPDAFMYLGLADGVSGADLGRALAGGRPGALERCLRRIPVRQNEVYDVTPGTVHALGPGLVLLEVQQPSDLTYRVSDWGRLGPDGKPRTTHPGKALQVIDPASRPGPVAARPLAGPVPGELLLDHDRFRLERWRVSGAAETAVDRLFVLTCLGGTGTVRSPGTPPVALERGASCVVPAAATMLALSGSGLDLAVAMAPR